jgi:hypothetical protein
MRRPLPGAHPARQVRQTRPAPADARAGLWRRSLGTLLLANLEPRRDIGAPTFVTTDATHLVSSDSRADAPLPCFGGIPGNRAARPPSRGRRVSEVDPAGHDAVDHHYVLEIRA